MNLKWPRLCGRAKSAPQPLTSAEQGEVVPYCWSGRFKLAFKKCEAPAAPSENGIRGICFSSGNWQFCKAKSFPGSRCSTFSKDDSCGRHGQHCKLTRWYNQLCFKRLLCCSSDQNFGLLVSQESVWPAGLIWGLFPSVSLFPILQWCTTKRYAVVNEKPPALYAERKKNLKQSNLPETV